ncbi:MAG: hypothetical protein LBV73_11340, partial [Paraburkholderia sp.]|nr:hypothetical protein [Paraburkholderia sp.]
MRTVNPDNPRRPPAPILPRAAGAKALRCTMSARRAAAIWCVLGIAALAVLVASLAIGSVPVTLGQALHALVPATS